MYTFKSIQRCFVYDRHTLRISSTEANAPFPISPHANFFTCGEMMETVLLLVLLFSSSVYINGDDEDCTNDDDDDNDVDDNCRELFQNP
mmetsp:Transcript_36630/g.41209  ORF Transcript_36630/g.41209 Transcript_36630/m.41209 type:complete len:89 (-) Transcript_36630:777-1043(-)